MFAMRRNIVARRGGEFLAVTFPKTKERKALKELKIIKF